MDSVSTCGVHGFLWGDAGWSCDNLEVDSRQNILEHTCLQSEVVPFRLSLSSLPVTISNYLCLP